MRDPYRVLGITPDATAEEVESAWRAAAKSAHPDQGGSDEEMAEINAARDEIRKFLSGDAKYNADDYDDYDPGAQQQPPPGGGGGRTWGYNPFGGGYGEAKTGEDLGQFVMGPDEALGFAPFGLHFRPEPMAPWHRLTNIPFKVSAYVEDPAGEGTAFEITYPREGKDATATIACVLFHDPRKLAARLERLGLQLAANVVVYTFERRVLGQEIARTKTQDVRAHELIARWLREQRPTRVKRMVDRSGWHETPNGWAFAYPDGSVLGAPGIILRRPGSDPDRDAKWVPRGTADDWRREVAARVLGNPWHAACLGLAFAGPLLAHLRTPPRGGLNGYGHSGIGKTIGTACGASVYGLGATDGLVIGWNATPSGMEEMAAESCDLALFLDDMTQAPAKHDVALIVYALANLAGRGRWRQPRLSWRVLMASTGEVSLAQFLGPRHMAGGLDARLPSFDVELPGPGGKKTSFVDTHGAPDHAAFAEGLEAACRTTYGAVGREWIAFLADHFLNAGRREELAGLLERRVADFVAMHAPQDPLGQVRRVARTLGLCAAAAELAVEHDFLNWPEGAATEAMAGLLGQWFEQRGTGSSRDRQIVEAIATFIVVHPNRFPKLDARGEGDVLGWREDTLAGEQILMLPPQWKELCRRCGVPDPAQAASLFADLGFMPRSARGNIGLQRTVAGYRRQWVRVLLPRFVAAGGAPDPDPDAEGERDEDRRRRGGTRRLAGGGRQGQVIAFNARRR